MLTAGRRGWTLGTWLVAAALALLLSLPAVWWEPLHADEVVTLRFAPKGLGEIAHDVFRERGGAPLHFFVEHFSLDWLGGLEGLRLPSVLFFLAALPAAGLFAWRLLGGREALLLPVALALAPMAVTLATFGRMYALFLAATLWATVAAVFAAERGRLVPWALAGVAAGLLVYVHPVAPLYSALVLLTGGLHGEDSLRRLLRTAWTAPLALALVQLPYYVYALGVLTDRYEVGLGAPRAGTTRLAGRSIPEQSLHALGPDALAGGIAFAVLATAGAVLAWQRRPRAAAALGLWVLVPVGFFTLVPTGSTFFFSRYLLPALPAYLLLVLAGSLGLGRFGRAGLLAGSLLTAGALAWQATSDVRKLDGLRELELSDLVTAVNATEGERIVFSATGVRPFAGRTARALDEYVLLEGAAFDKAPERDAEALAAFLDSDRRPAVGLWAFGGPPERIAAARERLAAVAGVEVVPVSPWIVLVRSVTPEEPRSLVEQALAVREAWYRGEPEDHEAERLVRVDRRALAGTAE
ncbi:MAG: hypothetical protein ACRDON_03435 [Gaiellaceae bacterium]